MECQDAFRTNYRDLIDPRRAGSAGGDCLVVAVADGLGSAPHSAVGSTLATALMQEFLLAECQVFDWDNASRDAVFACCARAARRAKAAWIRGLAEVSDALNDKRRFRIRRPESDIGAFKTTLIAVILRPPWCGVIQWGDGFVVVEINGEYELVTRQQTAFEYANQTRHLADSGGSPCITILSEPSISGVAVSTDGLEENVLTWDGIRPTAPKREFFDPIFNEVGDGTRGSARLLQLFRSPRVVEATGDDITMAVAARRRDQVPR